MLDVGWSPRYIAALKDALKLQNVFHIAKQLQYIFCFHEKIFFLCYFFAHSSEFFAIAFFVIFFFLSENSCLLQFNIIGQITETEVRGKGIVFWVVVGG